LATLCHVWFTIPEPLKFDGNDLNKALLRDPAFKLDIQVDKSAPNHFGIYHDTYRPDDANRSLHCYYLCNPDHKECVKSPPVGKAWYDTIPELIGEIEALERASQSKEQRQFPTDVIELVSKAKDALVHKKDKLENERVAKRRRLLEITNNSSHSSSNSEEGTMGGSDGCDGIDGENNGDDEEATSNGDNNGATSGPKPP
jgi:hypothetical protein